MDFKKRLIEELNLSTIQSQTMYDDYIEVCEKLAKEYHQEQLKNLGVIGDVRKRAIEWWTSIGHHRREALGMAYYNDNKDTLSFPVPRVIKIYKCENDS